MTTTQEDDSMSFIILHATEAYLFFNLDLGGITKLPREAELPCISVEKEKLKRKTEPVITAYLSTIVL